jgi:hypothetical protein
MSVHTLPEIADALVGYRPMIHKQYDNEILVVPVLVRCSTVRLVASRDPKNGSAAMSYTYEQCSYFKSFCSQLLCEGKRFCGGSTGQLVSL